MTLAFRLIARLDIRNEHLIKTIRLEGVRKLGDPAAYVMAYDKQGVDELLYLDVVASLYGRNGLAGFVERAAEEAFVPLTAGGGIRSVDDAQELLAMGADKIAVNTAAVQRPELLTEMARKFGAQAVVLQLDAKRKGDFWEAYTEGGREPSRRDAVEWARQAVGLGAGEVLVTSIDQEGTRRGCDLELIEQVAEAVSVPVVAAGGIGQARHTVEASRSGANGVAMAGALHFGHTTLKACRAELRSAGVAVRPS